MKANVLHQFGDSDQFILEEVEKPSPGENQVLLKVKAIGINPLDTKVRAGTNRIAKNMELPDIIGWDVSGVVMARGKRVENLKEGDAVFGCIGFPGTGGAYAEYAIAEPAVLAIKPENVSHEEAAALPIAGLTAYQAIHEHLAIKSGQKLLLQAAAGGVGHLSAQLAKRQGAYVYGTASAKNLEFLKSLGIDEAIDYKNEKFEDHISEVDAVQDAIGGEVLYRSIKCARKGGKALCLPSSTKNDPEAVKIAKAQGVSMEWPIMYSSKSQLEKLVKLVAEGKLKITIERIFPFNEMGKAHKAVETHAVRGKIVVKLV